MEPRVEEMDEILSTLLRSLLQLERSGKCCHGVTLSQCHTIDVLAKRGSLAMNELSRQMGLKKSTMTRIVNKMVQRGWIERVRDERDSRLVNIRLTRKGRGMAEKLDLSSREYIQRVLRHVPLEKMAQVVESLRWISKSVGKEVQKEENV